MDDLQAAQAAIESVKARLAAEHQPFHPQVPVGAMIETPAAAMMTSRLAAEVDFFSIGTNDLVQYLLTTDRTSSDMASDYEPLHPAVLEVLASVASAAKAKSKRVSICGEMAGNPAYTTLLLGLGFRSFSVSPGEIVEIKHAIRSASVQQADPLARQILKLGTIKETKEFLRDAAVPAAISR